MDGGAGMVIGSTAVPQYHHNGAPYDSTERGLWANLRFRCRRRCCCSCSGSDYGTEENRGCSAVTCRSVCTRLMLIAINLAFLLGGWLLVGIGVWVHVSHENLPYNILFRDNATGPLLILDRLPVTLVIIGTTISIIGFLGCCGACTESVCFLGFYAVLLVLSFVAQIAVATFVTTFHKQIRQSTIVSLQYQLRYEYNVTAKLSNNTDSMTYKVTTAWDTLQTQLNCCGALGPQDYHYSLWYNGTDHTQGPFVPQSCCKALRYPYDHTQCQMEAVKYVYGAHRQGDRDAIASNGKGTNFDQGALNGGVPEESMADRAQGCHSAIVNLMSSYMPFIFVIFTIDLLQLMNVVCACLLIGAVRRKEVDYSWCEEQDEVD